MKELWKDSSIWERVMLISLILGGLLFMIGTIGKLIIKFI